jgi:hypothetical protein
MTIKARFEKHGKYLYAFKGKTKMASYSNKTKKTWGATKYFPVLRRKIKEVF